VHLLTAHYALKISVKHYWLSWVTLQILQDYVFGFTIYD
jgi:hypothetical protein